MWDLWNQNLAPKQVVEGHYVLCWAAKWYKDDVMHFESIQKQSPEKMLKKMHKLLDEADVVVHYYGSRFDIPMLNAAFAKVGLMPPSPYKQVDLKKVVSDNFKFPSSKLEYVAKTLGLGEKISTTFDLWKGVMAGDKSSWIKMERYNRQDTRLLERLYNKLMPWIKNHPNHGAFQEKKDVCPNCGSKHIQKRGVAVAKLHSYQRYQCSSCSTWFRSNKAINNKRVERYVSV